MGTPESGSTFSGALLGLWLLWSSGFAACNVLFGSLWPLPAARRLRGVASVVPVFELVLKVPLLVLSATCVPLMTF